MSIVKELQEHHKNYKSYLEAYQNILQEALVENLIPYLKKSETKLIRVAKELSINEKNSLSIIMDVSSYPDDELISWYIDLSYKAIGSLSLNGCIDDFIFSKKFFIFKNQVRCTDINYKTLLRKIDDHNISIGTWPLLEAILEEYPSILDNVKNYYENLGFEVHISKDREKICLTLNWTVGMDTKVSPV